MTKYNKIYIEITNICNLNCSFCSKVERKREYITVNNFKKIVSKIKDYTDIIYLHVKGEPLLHKDLKELLDIAYNNKLKVNITTNGILINDKVDIVNSSKAISKINFSLHSENNKDNYLEDIFNSVSNINKDITIIYRLWTINNNDKTINKLKDYYNLPQDIVDKIYNSNNIKISNNIYVDKDNEFTWPSITSYQSNGYCHALKTHIAILVDGTVVPCCLDSNGIINLGNILEQDLEDIINSDRYQSLKKSFQNNKPCEKLCKSCTFKERLNK